MCLIKVNRIHLDLCTLQLLQRVIGGEDQFVTRIFFYPSTNYIWFGATEMPSFSRMHVHHRSISDKLQKFSRQLLTQKNSRSNDYNSFGIGILKLPNSIKNHRRSFPCPSWHHKHSFAVICHGIQSILLVGTKLNHVLHCV